MKKINKFEDITQQFLDNIKSDDIIEFNIEKFPPDVDFLILIKHIVLDVGAEIIDNINNIKIKKDNVFSNSYILEGLNDKIIYKRYQLGVKINNENNNHLLPIGSVVDIGNNNKLMITGRALVQEFDGNSMYTDYIGYSFPLGQVSEEKYVFNHENIKNLLHVGMQSEETDQVDLDIKEWLDNTYIKKYIFDVD